MLPSKFRNQVKLYQFELKVKSVCVPVQSGEGASKQQSGSDNTENSAKVDTVTNVYYTRCNLA